jgi:hypothetical protein
MAIVEITGDKDSVPIRIEIPGVVIADAKDIYTDQETRAIAKHAARAVAKTTEQIYEEAISMACEAAAQTARRIAAIEQKDRPDEFEVTFGLSLGMDVDTKIVSVDAGAQVQIRMQWNR